MESPLLSQDSNGIPRSGRFDDLYFSIEGGLEESRYVFQQHNQLAERFARLSAHQSFVIAETGFGTGLNFLATWQLFRERADPDARLIFISTELYPLSHSDIRQSLASFTELSPLLEVLLNVYPAAIGGYHSLELAQNIELQLLFGDACETLSELNAQVDAWYLDGFSPAKNPQLWQPELFSNMHRLSREGTTVATFTSARQVLEGLYGAGFTVEKKKGFGRKRNLLAARFTGKMGPTGPGRWPANEWAWPTVTAKQEVVVIGAGLAGAHTARELAIRGWQVTVLEQQDRLAAGASGNPQGAVYARLSHETSASNRFYVSALGLAQRRLKRMPKSVAHQSCGLLQLNQGSKEARRFAGFHQSQPYPDTWLKPVTAAEASKIAGIELNCEALYFPDGGWISPVDLVANKLNHANIRVLTGHRLIAMTTNAAGWTLVCQTRVGNIEMKSPQVILTNAWQVAELSPTAHLPIRPIGGQISQVASQGPLTQLRTVLCSDRYLVPAHEGKHCLGATFHLNRAEARCDPKDDIENLKQLRQRLPGLISDQAQIVGSRASVRAASPDYLPLVGPVIEPDDFGLSYAKALQMRRTDRLPAPPWQPSLWVNTAHGSKGLCTIPLCAKLLASWLHGEPLPLEQGLINHLNPNRFLIRGLIRAQR